MFVALRSGWASSVGCLYRRRLSGEPSICPGIDELRAALGPIAAVSWYELAALFSVDAFAGGFAVQCAARAVAASASFGLSLAQAGAVLLLVGRARAASQIRSPAGWRAASACVNTMVFTHIPSNLCLILAAAGAEPADGPRAAASCAAALSQMDVPTRSCLRDGGRHPARARRPPRVSPRCRAVLPPRPARRSPALFLRPVIEAWPLVICGVLKILYDLALLWAFRHIKPPEEAMK